MKTLSGHYIKKNIFKILELVKNGEDIIIKSDENQENLAVIIPFKKYHKLQSRPLGILKGKAQCVIETNFEISEEDLLKT